MGSAATLTHPSDQPMPAPHFREVVSWRSRLPYLVWRAGFLGKRAKTIILGTGEKLVLRLPPAMDTWTAAEVFLFQSYKPPVPLQGIKRIVDLGANVGCSVVYFAKQFPHATIEAFEPHPVHLEQLNANISANELARRVTVYPYAVGCFDRKLYLTDNESQSRLIENRVGQVLEVKVVDWFAFSGPGKIDLMKIDIEGSEYDILFDARFRTMHIPHLVLEWHATPERPNADRDIAELLTSLGYTLYHGVPKEIPSCRFGVLWAVKPDK